MTAPAGDLVPQEVMRRLAEACSDASSWLEARTRFQEATPDGKEEPYLPFVWALGYMLIERTSEERRQRAAGPFGASWEFEGRRFPPRISDLPETTAEAWEIAATKLEDPVGLSRLHDLLWEVKAGPRPDEHAREAIDCYRLVAERDDWHRMERVRCLTRALELSRSIGDQARESDVVESTVAFINDDLDSEEGGPGVSLTLLRALIDYRACETEVLVDLLARAQDRYGADPYQADSIIELRAQLVQDEEARADLRREQVAKWREAAQEGDGLLRSFRLEQALEKARTHHLTAEASDLRRELQEIKPEHLDLTTVSSQVEVPGHEVDAYIASFAESSGWQESLRRFGVHGPPGGSPEQLGEAIAQEMEEHPLTFLFTKVVLGPDSATPMFRASDQESHRRLALAERLRLHSSFWGLFAVDILAGIERQHGRPNPRALGEFFTTELIEPEVAERIARSFDLYWDGHIDEAAHTLVPRIEAISRELARRAGIPIINEPIGARPGGVRSLGAILIDLRQVFADRSWALYLENLLIDPLGGNLRNVIAHGLQRRIEATDASLLLHATCYLRELQVQDREKNVGDLAKQAD